MLNEKLNILEIILEFNFNQYESQQNVKLIFKET